MSPEAFTKGQRAAAWFASTTSAFLGAGAVFVGVVLWLGDIKSEAASAKAMGDRNDAAVGTLKNEIKDGFRTLSEKMQSQGAEVILLAGKIGAEEGRTSAIEGVVNAEIRPQIVQLRETTAKMSADVTHILEAQRETKDLLQRMLDRIDKSR